MLAGLPDAASTHTQLLVYRQEWSELQRDLLAKVDQPYADKTVEGACVHIAWPHSHHLCVQQAGQHVQLPTQCSEQQRSNELLAVVQSLDSAYQTAHSDLLAAWPTAVESPVLQDELPKLYGTGSHR